MTVGIVSRGFRLRGIVAIAALGCGAMVFRLILLLAAANAVAAIGQNTNSGPAQTALSILTQQLPNGIVRHSYGLQLLANGGAAPLSWQVVEGNLPSGLQLDQSGFAAGSPAQAGQFRSVVAGSDSSASPVKTLREFALIIPPPLALQWRQAPALVDQTISGDVLVSNYTTEAFDLTFIVVAVDEIGKAFALGYQHFVLPAQTEQQVISFGSTLPFGSYVVLADAIAEVPATNAIYRVHLQTAGSLTIEAP